MMTHLMT